MMKTLAARCAFLLFVLPLSAVNQLSVSSDEARSLVAALLPNPQGVTVELDREQGQCAVYHAYHLSKPPSMTFTLGWWSIDNRTAEVWDDLNSKLMTNQRITEIQRAIRKRLGVTDDEVLKSISNPCYERDFSK